MASEVVAQTLSPGKPKQLLEQVRDLLRLKHYSLRTERSYCDWIERFIHVTARGNAVTPGGATLRPAQAGASPDLLRS